MSHLSENATGLSRLVWTAGIVIGASLPHWTVLPPWMPGLVVVCVAWRFASRLLQFPLPPAWLRWTATIAAFGGVLFEFRTINGLMPGTALLVVMVALKFLEARTQRDQMLLMVIAYFLVFAGLLAGGGLVSGLYLLTFVFLTTLGLLQIGRQGALLPIPGMARQSGAMLLQAVPIMILLFLLFPRLSGPLWSMPGDDSSATTGLSDSMSPGDITNLGLSDAIAFRVDFEDQPPAPADLYWRGPVLTQFNGRRWSLPGGMRGDNRDSLEHDGNPVRYRVTLENESRWALALEMPAEWSGNSRRPGISMSSDYNLRIWPFDQSRQRVSYDVTSYTSFRAMENLTERERSIFTNLPPGDLNPRTRALMADIVASAADAGAIIEQSLDVFREDDFFYTLSPPPLGEHTADDFLFETREGFCEHYASTFAIMMRMAGLPARVVTGYQGGELNATLGSYFIIRQSDAHAWTEVWIEDQGWIRVDPIAAVAPERLAIGSGSYISGSETSLTQRIGRMTALRQIALTWDAVNTMWREMVIDYGPGLQRELLEWFGFERPRMRDLLILCAIASAIIIAGLVFWFGLLNRRWHFEDPAHRAWRHFISTLAGYRIAPPEPAETPTSYAARAAAGLPQLGERIRAVVRSYLAARYEPDATGTSLRRLQVLVRNFRRDCTPASR